MAQIRNVKDNGGNVFYPLTHERAVRDSNGVNLETKLGGKENTIPDLSTIRSGAAAGATAYQKPGTGIPFEDMASGIQTSLGKADTAYQKPSGGIPKTDMVEEVQEAIAFADSSESRPYDSQTPNGMGYLVLEKDKTFAAQVTAANTIYEIRYDFDLNNASVTIPAGCVLKFNGGKVKNGTVVFNETTIQSKAESFNSCSFSGKLANGQTLNISTFGVNADGTTDDAPVINGVLSCISERGCVLLFDKNTDYAVSKPNETDGWSSIQVGSDTTLKFVGGGYLKAVGHPLGGQVLRCVGAASSHLKNITIENPQIDGGGATGVINEYGVNGIGCANVDNLRIVGGDIKNCYLGSGTGSAEPDGGSGIALDGYGVSDAVIDGTNFTDCEFAIRSSRNMSYSGNNTVFIRGIVASNCRFLLGVNTTNSTDESSISEANKVFLDNFIAKDCGAGGGVILLSRARGCMISNGTIYGSTSVDGIVRGRGAKCVFRNINIHQPSTALINNIPLQYNYGADTTQMGSMTFEMNCHATTGALAKADNSVNKSIVDSVFNVFFKSFPSNTGIVSGSPFSSGRCYFDLNFEGSQRYVGNWTILAVQFGEKKDNLLPVSIGSTRTYGTTAQAPSLNSGQRGVLYYNTDTQKLQVWNGFVWIDVNLPRAGATSARPSLTSGYAGFLYYDTDLGKMIVWNGSAWVNMDGTALS